MRRGWSRVPIRLAPNGERENRQMKNSAIDEHDQREIVEARGVADVEAERHRPAG